MKKYLALAALGLLASCTSAQLERRPSREAAYEGEKKLNEAFGTGLHESIDRTGHVASDVVNDTAGMTGNFGRDQTRRYAGTTINATRYASNVVSRETRNTADTVLDITDDTVDLGNEQVSTYTGIVNKSAGRLMCTSGKIVGTGVETYANTTHTLFGGIVCLFKRTVVDTKPFMVGSANDQDRCWKNVAMPGESWNRPFPESPQYVVAPAPTSGKQVTFSK
ncbi:MAG TPA: hypothetical protein DIT64_01905 [Verrucomicrobiales bacterium]|nr:hypothetical protein [Verrucomicrobiales bacterium]HCN77041.1 hypothetical protein [Verrucomicrobiales bacterium]HRJ09872.1 hypothetical protein [Prosthecobacter sp.]HRK14398.1 hypothetical protein [Prosthecobacter sp.]